MNADQKFPGNGSPLPLLLLCGLAFVTLQWLFSAKDKEKKPEAAPVDAGVENRRKEAETIAFRQIPAEISVKPAAAPVPAVVAIPKIAAQAPPPPIKKKLVTREDMATVFQRGARPLTRPVAVAALKSIGFGKSAAYEALLEDGRFASWLRFAPDGTITWRG